MPMRGQSMGMVLLQVLVVLAGAGSVAYGANRTGQLSVLEYQRSNGKNCPNPGVKVTSTTKTINQVFVYGGLGLILMAFILAHMGSFGGFSGGFRRGYGGGYGGGVSVDMYPGGI